jgi:hypothetical protein
VLGYNPTYVTVEIQLTTSNLPSTLNTVVPDNWPSAQIQQIAGFCFGHDKNGNKSAE